MKFKIFSNRDKTLAIYVFYILGGLSFLVAVFGQNWVDVVTINEERITMSDPRFSEKLWEVRRVFFIAGWIWIMMAVGLNYWRRNRAQAKSMM